MATLTDGVDFCREVNEELESQGLKGHVALSGGCLYKDGDRKDIDIIIYRPGSTDKAPIDQRELFNIWLKLRCMPIRFFGRVTKMKWQGHHIDVIQPEYDGEYITPEE